MMHIKRLLMVVNGSSELSIYYSNIMVRLKNCEFLRIKINA